MKKKFILYVFILLKIAFAQNISPTKINKSIELSIGFNYSKLFTTDNIGGNGVNFGVYKRREFKNNWQLKTGIDYTTKSSKLKNVTVLPLYMIDWDADNYLYWRNFDLNYTYLDINTFLEIPIYTYKKLKISTLFGCGLDLQLNEKNKLENVKHELYDQDKDKDQYDYSTGDHDVPPGILSLLDNIGFTLQTGGSFIFDKVVLNIYYERSILNISYIDNMEFGEKFHTFNTTIGYIIK